MIAGTIYDDLKLYKTNKSLSTTSKTNGVL